MGFDFLLTSLIVVASPSTGVLYTLVAGLSRGGRAGVAAAFGCTVGIVPHMAAAAMGLATVLHASALAFQALKWLGVAYLLCMAWSTLRERGALQVEAAGARSTVRVAVTAVLVNILNPKLSIFFLAFLPQFIAAEAVLVNILNPKLSIFFLAFLPQFVGADEPHPLSRMVALSAVFMAMTFAVFAVYGLLAASVREHVVSRPRVLAWMRRAFAGAFGALGAKLAFAER